jgi:hypothetical protein
MVPDDFVIGIAETFVFWLSFVSVIVFAVAFGRLLFRRDSSLICITTWVVLLTYGLALIFALVTPEDPRGLQMPLWFPVIFRILLGLSVIGLIVLALQKRLKAYQRWVSLLGALVIGWLIYLSIQHSSLTMS